MPSLLRGIRRVVARFSRSGVFRRLGPRMLPPLERAMTRLTGGRVPLSGLLVPSLVLHTIGARSGVRRDTTLMYCPEGAEPRSRMLVVGSNFGRAEHPGWTANLLAEPDVAVTVRGRRVPVRATLVSDAERDAVWRTLEDQWPGYREYEVTAGRVLRIFRLDPTSPPIE